MSAFRARDASRYRTANALVIAFRVAIVSSIHQDAPPDHQSRGPALRRTFLREATKRLRGPFLMSQRGALTLGPVRRRVAAPRAEHGEVVVVRVRSVLQRLMCRRWLTRRGHPRVSFIPSPRSRFLG